jgi:membrane protease YdiL (CAAX protease family)
MTYKPWQKAILLVLWVLLSFFAAQILISAVLIACQLLNVSLSINQSVAQTLVAAAIYLLTLLILIGVPWISKGRKVSKEQLGLSGLPTWLDLGLGPAGYIVYTIGSIALISIVKSVIPGFDDGQAQDVGFQGLSMQYEYILAFATLVVIAPVAEEIVFRGYLYGKLRRHLPIWVAMVITSALFGFVHFQWNVGLDVFILSIVACSLREVTGSIWAGILLHMIKNGIAFYLLFINPSFLIQ